MSLPGTAKGVGRCGTPREARHELARDLRLLTGVGRRRTCRVDGRPGAGEGESARWRRGRRRLGTDGGNAEGVGGGRFRRERETFAGRRASRGGRARREVSAGGWGGGARVGGAPHAHPEKSGGPTETMLARSAHACSRREVLGTSSNRLGPDSAVAADDTTGHPPLDRGAHLRARCVGIARRPRTRRTASSTPPARAARAARRTPFGAPRPETPTRSRLGANGGQGGHRRASAPSPAWSAAAARSAPRRRFLPFHPPRARARDRDPASRTSRASARHRSRETARTRAPPQTPPRPSSLPSPPVPTPPPSPRRPRAPNGTPRSRVTPRKTFPSAPSAAG